MGLHNAKSVGRNFNLQINRNLIQHLNVLRSSKLLLLGADAEKRLVTHTSNFGSKISTNRYYISVGLAKELWIDHKLLPVGTHQTNKKEFPGHLKSLGTGSSAPVKCKVWFSGSKYVHRSIKPLCTTSQQSNFFR